MIPQHRPWTTITAHMVPVFDTSFDSRFCNHMSHRWSVGWWTDQWQASCRDRSCQSKVSIVVKTSQVSQHGKLFDPLLVLQCYLALLRGKLRCRHLVRHLLRVQIAQLFNDVKLDPAYFRFEFLIIFHFLLVFWLQEFALGSVLSSVAFDGLLE